MYPWYVPSPQTLCSEYVWFFAGDTTNRTRSIANMLFTMIESLEAVGSPLEHVFFAEVTQAHI